MLGNPKYKRGDIVGFTFTGNEKDIKDVELEGEVFIVDSFGTFAYPEDVSYDIMVEHSPHFNGKKCLYKHIPEKYVYQ